MISELVEYRDGPVSYTGKSTDAKPANTRNGSTFFEMDTGKVYMFDGDAKTWLEI